MRVAKPRYCAWCGEELSRELVKRNRKICDKDECRRDWWADFYERRKEETRKRNGSWKCLACQADIWVADKKYCNIECLKAYRKKRLEERTARLRALSHLPTHAIAQRLGLSEERTREHMARCGIKRMRPRSEIQKIKEEVIGLTQQGWRQCDIARSLNITQSCVAGYVYRERAVACA